LFVTHRWSLLLIFTEIDLRDGVTQGCLKLALLVHGRVLQALHLLL